MHIITETVKEGEKGTEAVLKDNGSNIAMNRFLRLPCLNATES